MRRIWITPIAARWLGAGVLAAATIGLASPAQANFYSPSVQCTETVQEQTYTIQGPGDVRITEVRPQVVRTCYEQSSNFSSNSTYSTFSNSTFSNSTFSNYPYSTYPSVRRHHVDHYRQIVQPQIQIRLGPNLSITNGWDRNHRGYRHHR
jgi:hypothetical protein